MSKNNLDAIFKNRLGNLQQVPSEKATAKFDQMLAQRHKKPVIWWQVAAAIAVFGVSAVIWYSQRDQSVTETIADVVQQEAITPISEMAQPTQQEVVSLAEVTSSDNVKDASSMQNEIASTNKTMQTAKAVTTLKGVDEITHLVEKVEMVQVAKNVEEAPVEVIALEEKVTEALANLDETVTENLNKTAPIITITYIPSSPEVQQSMLAAEDQERPTFKSILQNASNVALMAELRYAKDDFLSSPFSLKNKKVKN